MHVLVPLVAALVPLVITPGLLSYFDITPKIAILLLGAALSLSYWRTNISNIRVLTKFRAGRWFVWLIGGTWFVSAIATGFSGYPQLSLHGGNWRRDGLVTGTGLLLFVLISAAWLTADGKNIRTLLRACTASGALAALYGIAQYFGWDPWLPSKAYEAGEGAFTIVRPPGTLGHADYFAAWLVVITFFGLALARLEKAEWRRILALAVSVLATIAILLSGTRSALLGLFGGAIALAFLRRGRISARGVALAAVFASGLSVFYFSPAGARLRARVYWSTEDAWGGARLLLWRDSLGMALQRPLAGYGPETFATEFPRFESVALARAYPDFYHESPHNMFLDALTTRGLAGLLLVAGLCGLAIWEALRRARPELGAGFAALLVSQQFVVFIPATALYLYLLVALLVVEPPTAPAAGRSLRWLWPLGAGAGIVFVLFALHLVMADRALAITNQRIRSGDALGAAREYQTVLAWLPLAPGAVSAFSRSMSPLRSRSKDVGTRVQAYQQALEAGIRATKTAEDRHNAWYNLAMLLATQNDATGVERGLRNAITWAPNWFKPHWALAQLLEKTNHHAEALAEARLAASLDGGRDPEVLQFLEQLQKVTPTHP